jgi:hypothetical protein
MNTARLPFDKQKEDFKSSISQATTSFNKLFQNTLGKTKAKKNNGKDFTPQLLELEK